MQICLRDFSYLLNFSGVTEIRTRDTLLAYTRFPGVPLQPLEHHSNLKKRVDFFYLYRGDILEKEPYPLFHLRS